MNSEKRKNIMPVAIPLPGYARIEHMASCHSNDKLFLLASKPIPLSSSDRELQKEIKSKEKEVFGAMQRKKRGIAITLARTELKELLERRKAYELVRIQEAHGLFIGNYRRLQQAEILDMSLRRGNLESVAYSIGKVNGRLLLPSPNGHSEPMAVHDGEKIPLRLLVNRVY